jgi:glycosyltransferase involved in cell wall biosynthesis
MKLEDQALPAITSPPPVASPVVPMLRIALISDHASPLAAPGSIDCGGQNVYVAHLARELAMAGHQVDVFTRRDAIGQKQLVRWRENIRVVNVPAGPAHHVPKEQLLPYVQEFARFTTRFATRLARQQRAGYDIVHANFFMSGMVAQHLRQTLGIPFVITFHALGQVRRLAQGADDAFPPSRMRIETLLMQQAARIIAECPQDRLDMEQLYGASPGNIVVAPCGFDPGELWPQDQLEARSQLGLEFGPGASRFTVLQLGRMVPRKGVDTVIQATALLRSRHGIDAQLLVVGGDIRADGSGDPEIARLRSLAQRLGIPEHVRFVGQKPRAELRTWYSAADVFVTTPWYEPFGITPVEAMACARPVVGSEVGGIKSTVVDGSTGFLVPSRDPQAVADRLATLQRNPLLARTMGDAGLRRAYRHYTWRSVAQQVAAVYAGVLAEAQSRAPIDLTQP